MIRVLTAGQVAQVSGGAGSGHPDPPKVVEPSTQGSGYPEPPKLYEVPTLGGSADPEPPTI